MDKKLFVALHWLQNWKFLWLLSLRNCIRFVVPFSVLSFPWWGSLFKDLYSVNIKRGCHPLSVVNIQPKERMRCYKLVTYSLPIPRPKERKERKFLATSLFFRGCSDFIVTSWTCCSSESRKRTPHLHSSHSIPSVSRNVDCEQPLVFLTPRSSRLRRSPLAARSRSRAPWTD